MNPRTITGLLQTRCAISPVAPAFFTLDPDKHWKLVRWDQVAQNVARVAASLSGIGVGKGDRVGILARTSLEWEYAQMGALAIGAIVAGLDPGYPRDQLNFVVRQLDPFVLFVQDRATLAQIDEAGRERIRLIILFDGNPESKCEYSIQHILAVPQEDHKQIIAGPEPKDPAVMVFSSGTTGSPKAIVFSHEQVRDAIDAILEAFDDVEEGTVLLCWLPLSNLFQRVINFFAMARGAISYILSDPRQLVDHIGRVEPHILIGVPRVFERMQAGIAGRIAKLPRPIRQLIIWSLRLGREQAIARVAGKRQGGAATIGFYFLDKLILKQFRALFGGRLRYFVSGSAAMPLWLLEWFEGIGLPVLEAYGISENIVPMSVNRFSLRKCGTVGKPLAQNEIRLAPDGEILVRGPGVFHGYWNTPATSMGRFTDDKYWCTGDFGYIDEDGFLTLLGRKSEVFKTSGGRWVSPTRIEERLGQVAGVEHSVVLQMESSAIGCILSIDKSKLNCIVGKRYANEDLDEEEFLSLCVQVLKADLAEALEDIPVYQRPAGIIITFQQFSIEGGELTSNLKLRREFVVARFGSHLKQLEATIAKISEIHSTPKPIVLLA